MLEEPRMHKLTLTWSFGKKGVPTCINDPVMPKRRMRIMKLEIMVTHYSLKETDDVGVRLMLRGATGAGEKLGEDFNAHYRAVTELFNSHVTGFFLEKGTVFVRPGWRTRRTAFLGSIISAIEEMYMVVSKLGLRKLPKPRIDGSLREVVLSNFYPRL